MGQNRDLSRFPNAITALDNGNVGIGTTSPSTIISGARVLQVSGSSYGFVLASSGTVTAQMIGDAAGNVAFGSRSNHSVTLTTNDTERVRITTSGNVGIGTNSPSTLLDVSPGSSFANNPTIKITSSYADGYDAILQLQNTHTGGQNWHIRSTNNSQGNFGGGKLIFSNQSTSISNTTFALTSAGNVGIGTNAPVVYSGYTSLHIAAATSTGSAIVYLTNSTSTIRGLMYAEGTNSNITFGSQSNHDVRIVSNDTERVRVSASGNIGIGYSSPLCRLHIGPEGSVGGQTPTVLVSTAAGTKPSFLITEYTARSGAFGYDSSNYLALATEASVTAGIKLKVGSSFQSGLLNTGTDALIINGSGQIQRPSQPSFLAYSTNSGFAAPTGGWGNISTSITEESYDIGNNYSSGRFTAPVAGRYLFYAGGWAGISTNGERYAFSATVNGGTFTFITGGNYSITDSPLASYTVVHNLSANDYVDLFAFSQSGGTWGYGTHRLFFGGYLL